MIKKANRSVIRTFNQKCEESVIGAMSIAIAWTIEESIKSNRGDINASIKEISGWRDEYTVIFTINGRDVSSVWIREYGNWRIKSFGTAASGDVERLNRRQIQRDTLTSMKPDSFLRVQAGYGFLFSKSPFSLYIDADFKSFGINFYYINSDFWSLGIYTGWQFPFAFGNIGFMPYIRTGGFYNFDFSPKRLP